MLLYHVVWRTRIVLVVCCVEKEQNLFYKFFRVYVLNKVIQMSTNRMNLPELISDKTGMILTRICITTWKRNSKETWIK